MKKRKIMILVAVLAALCALFASPRAFAMDITAGDVNGDGAVTGDDAIYILRHTFSAEDYVLACSGDVNGDEAVTSDDAIYVLRHTFSPEDYPLHSGCAHKKQTIPAVARTFLTDGLTEGTKCSVCREILVEQETLPCYNTLCSDDYGYNYFSKMENGEKYTELYRRIDAFCESFHENYERSLTSDVLVWIECDDLDIDEDDALAVWSIYKNDNPLFYWLSTHIGYTNNSQHKCTALVLITEEECYDGSARKEYNETVYSKIEEYLALTADMTSDYEIALTYYEAIINAIDYAYKSDGVTPDDSLSAHSILGVFEGTNAVCEGYSRTYHLLLNASGVDSIYVSGTANGGGHSWNLIKLDDDNWYWCDVTWGDQKWGIYYGVFCALDADFLVKHSYDLPTGKKFDFLYALPERATAPFAGEFQETLSQFCAGEIYLHP